MSRCWSYQSNPVFGISCLFTGAESEYCLGIVPRPFPHPLLNKPSMHKSLLQIITLCMQQFANSDQPEQLQKRLFFSFWRKKKKKVRGKWGREVQHGISFQIWGGKKRPSSNWLLRHASKLTAFAKSRLPEIKAVWALPCAHLEGERPAPLCVWSRSSRVGICKVSVHCASLCAAASSRHWSRWRYTCHSGKQLPAGTWTAWNGRLQWERPSPLWGQHNTHSVTPGNSSPCQDGVNLQKLQRQVTLQKLQRQVPGDWVKRIGMEGQMRLGLWVRGAEPTNTKPAINQPRPKVCFCSVLDSGREQLLEK